MFQWYTFFSFSALKQSTTSQHYVTMQYDLPNIISNVECDFMTLPLKCSWQSTIRNAWTAELVFKENRFHLPVRSVLTLKKCLIYKSQINYPFPGSEDIVLTRKCQANYNIIVDAIFDNVAKTTKICTKKKQHVHSLMGCQNNCYQTALMCRLCTSLLTVNLQKIGVIVTICQCYLFLLVMHASNIFLKKNLWQTENISGQSAVMFFFPFKPYKWKTSRLKLLT